MNVDHYSRVVAWEPDDELWVGYSPDLFIGGVRGASLIRRLLLFGQRLVMHPEKVEINVAFVGALKLSNLLQLDRFEEDLNISRVRLKPAATRSKDYR